MLGFVGQHSQVSAAIYGSTDMATAHNEDMRSGSTYSNITVSGHGRLHAGHVFNSESMMPGQRSYVSLMVLQPITTATRRTTHRCSKSAGLSGICHSVKDRLEKFVHDSEPATPGAAKAFLKHISQIKDALVILRSLEEPSRDLSWVFPVRVGHIVVSFTNAVLLLDQVDTALSSLLKPSAPCPAMDDDRILWYDPDVGTLNRKLRWQSLAFVLQLATLRS